MNNLERVATLGTQYTGRRQPKSTKKNRKLKMMSNTAPTKNRGWGWTQVLLTGKMFMFLIRHPQCYLYSQYITICKQSPITNKTYLSTPTSNRTWFVCGNRSGHDNTFTPVYGGVRVALCFSFLCCVFVLFVFVLSCVLNVASFSWLSIIGCAKNKHKQHNKTSVLLQTTLKTNRTSYQRIINTD
jgi:hypothetical protein